MTKKVTTETQTLVKFSAKKIGANIVATIGEERYSRKVSKEEGELIFAKIDVYNKRPSDAKKKELIKLLTPAATLAKENKEKVEAKTKGLKHQLKKEIKKNKSSDKEEKTVKRDLMGELEAMLTDSPEAVDKLQALLNKFKKVEKVAPKEQYTKNPRRQETNRNGRTVYIYVAEDGTEVDSQGYKIAS